MQHPITGTSVDWVGWAYKGTGTWRCWLCTSIIPLPSGSTLMAYSLLEAQPGNATSSLVEFSCQKYGSLSVRCGTESCSRTAAEVCAGERNGEVL